MNVAEWLYSRALVDPDAPALLTGEAVVANYAAFAARAGSLAAALRDIYGIVAGDRVAIFMRNRSEYLEALFSILWLGAAVTPINAKLAAKEAQFIVQNAGARLVIVSDDVGAALCALDPSLRILSVDDPAWPKLRAHAPMARPQPREGTDLAWLFYTSGTTGQPKGVMLTHGNIVAASLCYYADVDMPGHADATLYAAPISHGAGLYSFQNVRAGARHVVPASGGFDPEEILDLAKSLRNLTLFAAPTMVRRLVDCARQRGEDGDGVRTVIYGGGPMYLADIEEAVRVMGPRFVQIYGQGESPMTITALGRDLVANRSHPRWRERLASVGTVQSCVEIRLVGPDGASVATGEVGEIVVRGPQVMAGYWNNDEASAEALRGGWLHTGDLGRLDADGFLTLTDRSKDVIISGGANIYPREVEEALLLHGQVREVSVIGMPNPEWGEEVVAFVVSKTGEDIDIAALDRTCLDNIARFKRPKRYIFMQELPKNNYGKVLKTELRKMRP